MDVQKTKVILVGNSTFPKWGGESKDIPNVEENLESLKKILVDKNYFGIPDAQTHLVEIKDATSQDILLQVKHETKSFAGKDQFERLIFYYSGHGIPGEDRKLFFASRDTVRKDYEITSVDSTRLFSYLEGFRAKELIVILDCCYAAQSKENLGDPDTLINNSLPEQKEKLHETENGAYYLFAAGKDNVAKFNPLEPHQPTYFTEALISSIRFGTKPGQNYITIGEIYKQLCLEIADLKKNKNTDIPDPRPVLHGEVNGFLFCKNIKFENQEDKDWLDLFRDPSLQKILDFSRKYPDSRFDSDKDQLTRRLMKGQDELKEMRQSKDINLAIQIKSDYKDIPWIKDDASRFINDLTAKKLEEYQSEIERATSDESPSSKDASSVLIDSAATNLDEKQGFKTMTQNSSRPGPGNRAR